LLGTSVDEDNFYLICELYEDSLEELLAMRVKLSFNLCQAITAQLIIAIHFLQQNGVLHRDLCPQNIMLDSNKNVKLIDFGSARKLDSESKRQSLVGSLNYLSPEMIRGQPASLGSDLWALGCIVFQMSTGRTAFPGLQSNAVQSQIESGVVDWPADIIIDPSCINFVT
jgi:3-phosphoinositide dependent protein kinase-1